MKNSKIDKEIRKRDEIIYKLIEQKNALEDKARGLRLENSTLASRIADLSDKIEKLERQVAELRRKLYNS